MTKPRAVPPFRPGDRVMIRGRLATVSHLLHNQTPVVRYDGETQTRVVPLERVEAVGDYSSSGSSVQS